MANNAQCRGDRAEVWVGGVAEKRDFLTVLFVLLRPPANAYRGDVGRGGIGDVLCGGFFIEEELAVLHNDSNWQRGPGSDAFVVGLGCLTLFGGTESGVSP